ncbi:MAG TPA: serine hydrolase [Candidatus Acidoferrales bacterium]|nr:serine hydrolase [Candidatus Acidoferrales bacterium]
MNPNIFQPLPVLSTGEIREILVKRIGQQKQAVGIVAGVIEPSGRRVVAYGNLANGDPRTLDGDTIFEIGSVTKVFTSLLLADMVNRKEVALDDPAAKYLPENAKMPERSGKSITLLDLSTHSSGLPPLPGNLKPEADYSVDDLYQFLSGYTLPRDPGSEYEYSNLGAGLLGHLLACRAGTDYESLIRSRIARPLSMPDTGIMRASSMNQRMATGHNAMLAPVANSDLPTPLTGAGALRSTAKDMLTFLEAFLGYRESPLAPAMKAMLEVRRPAGQVEIGLGWLIYSTDGREIAGHNGRTGGFRSFAGYDPEARIGVVVLSNASTPSGVDDIGLHLLNPKLPLANPEPPKQHTEIHIDPKLLDRYTGRYQVMPNLIFEITRDGDRLFAQGFAQVTGQAIVLPKFELFAEGEKNFFARVADNHIAFETGPEGRATCLILHRAGRDMPAPRLP